MIDPYYLCKLGSFNAGLFGFGAAVGVVLPLRAAAASAIALARVASCSAFSI
jgi:hypothetical protein